MSDLKNPHIRAGGEAYTIVRDAIVEHLGDSVFIHSLRVALEKYFIILNTRKASRKSFKRRRW